MKRGLETASSGEGGLRKLDVDGGIGRRFWNKFRSESVFALYTPFFVCLASGKLKTAAFLHSISQDAFFLNAFAQAFEMAEEFADDEDDKNAILKLRKRVKERIKSLNSLVRDWGFELPTESTSSNTTVGYINFLKATAAGKIEGEKVPGKIATPFEKTKLAAYTLGAIAPWLRLFTFINKEIQALLDPKDNSHIYKKCIDNYCSEKYEASALQAEELLDTLSVSLTSEELEVLEKLYHQAMRLQVEFFSSQPVVQQTVAPLSRVQQPVCSQLTIFCDFDLTCTAFDSSAILAEIAIVTAPKVGPDGSKTHLIRMSSADLKNKWGTLSVQYTEEFEQCIESITARERGGKFNYEGLCEALEKFADFEKKANLRIAQSGVLKGLNQEEIKRAGQNLILQDGCRGFFHKLLENQKMKTDVHVLSYCWCGDLIRSAFSSGDLNGLNVYSNELSYEESISTGEIVKKVESPMEKLQAFRNISKERSRNTKNLTVYIGGSIGDLLCLLEADIGIVMSSSPSLIKLGDQFGISFIPLFSSLVEKQKQLVEGNSSTWKNHSGIIYTVSSWAEIHAFVLGT